MFIFMFGVLGSFIFWGVYFLISLIAGTIITKAIAPRIWKFISTGYRNKILLPIFEVFIYLVVIYALWPIFTVAFGIYYFIGFVGKHIVWKPFCSIVKLIDQNMPTVTIKKK